ncbi:MAG: hypothetical protein GY714_23770 [Desulfobacterales bacterium]|nr:hypothetical protein [Desulfobacterales bacterium]MCP4161807.1 hypothetical protein [Deltaproteobacteria bacterium]
MQYPEINELILDSCCSRNLLAMKRCSKAFKWGKYLFGGSILAAVFIGPGDHGVIPTVGSMHGTDWKMFARGAQNLPKIPKAAIYNMAAVHLLELNISDNVYQNTRSFPE